MSPGRCATTASSVARGLDIHLGHAGGGRRFRATSRKRLGLDEPRELLQPSPFDWRHQALCYLPRGLPEPEQPRLSRRACSTRCWPVLEASNGRAFLLFTSHRALREAAEALRDAPLAAVRAGHRAAQHAARTVPRLRQRRAAGRRQFLGRRGRGRRSAVSVVVIDRLPFAAPDDPVLEARAGRRAPRRRQSLPRRAAAAAR